MSCWRVVDDARLGRGLGLALLGEEHGVDVREHAAGRDRDRAEELVELLVVLDGQGEPAVGHVMLLSYQEFRLIDILGALGAPDPPAPAPLALLDVRTPLEGGQVGVPVFFTVVERGRGMEVRY